VPEGEPLSVVEGVADRDGRLVQPDRSRRLFHCCDSTLSHRGCKRLGDAERPRDEPPGQPRLVSRQTKRRAGRVGSIELLGGVVLSPPEELPVG